MHISYIMLTLYEHVSDYL